jgi:hypothetical protein
MHLPSPDASPVVLPGLSEYCVAVWWTDRRVPCAERLVDADADENTLHADDDTCTG